VNLIDIKDIINININKMKKLKKSEYKKLLNTKETPKVNQCHIILGIIEFDFSPEVISKELKLEPYSTGIKGEEYFAGDNKQIRRIRECNYWEYEWKLLTNEFIGDIIERFINEIILPRVEVLKNLSINSEIIFTIVQYYYDGYNPGIFISSKHLKILSEINSSVDIDLYCLSEDE
jgi:hypothetical protein